MRRSTSLAVPLGLAALLGAGCASTQNAGTKPAGKTAQTAPAQKQNPAHPTPAGAGGTVAMPELSPVYFEFDSASLSSEGQARLNALAEYLRQERGARVAITGHCDDRGTSEYNLALGDQRARAARDYLVRLGVDASRISSVSRGEESPAAEGSGETIWAKNRRDEIEVLGAPSARR